MDIFRTLSVEAVSEVAGAPASISVELTRQTVTEHWPAELEATFHWLGDERVQTGDPLMAPVSSHNPSPGLCLVDEHIPPRYHDTSRRECWRVDDPAGPPAGLGMPVNQLNPGESTSNELQVWTEYDLDGCMPPNTYHFKDTLSIGPQFGDEKVTFSIDTDLLDIEFALRVEQP